MVKILMGLAAAVVIAVGGFFGFEFYMQHRVAGEVDAAFEQIRATGGKASHGKVSFDLLNRTVRVADIVSESAAQPPVSLKIARVTASGVSQPDPARFAADSIEATDIEIGLAMTGQAGLNVTYKMPRITAKDYSGPASLQRPPASSSFIDVYRFALEQFAGITAASITAPSLAGTMSFGAAAPGGGEFTYTGFAMQGIKGGKIDVAKVDGVVFNVTMQQAGKTEKLTGNLANIASYDVDINAAAAMFDPQKANDDRTYRAYREISAGPYIVTSGQGMNMRIDGITIDEVGLKPSRLQLPALLAMIPPAGAAPPTPAQARELMEKVAKLYEGIHIGNAEMRGLSVETPQGPLKLAAMRFNLESGKIGELAFEGLDTRAPKGPVKVGRFALKSLDISNLMRMGAQFAAQKPAPDQALALLPLIEGAEVKGLVAPYKNTDKQVSIDMLSLDWGQFVGPIPSKAHLIAKMIIPNDATDPAQAPLVAAGLDKAAVDLEFSINPVQAANMAAHIEAGTLELTLRDTGGVDLAVAMYARMQNVSPDDARRAVIETIKTSTAEAATTNPDVAALADALARFVESPKGTLTLKLTPHGKVPAMQLVQVLKIDPLTALAQFQVEASTTR